MAVFGDGKVSLDEKHLFGSDEEIASRVNTGYERVPQNNAPAFRQIEPSIAATDMTNAPQTSHTGDLKFTPGKP